MSTLLSAFTRHGRRARSDDADRRVTRHYPQRRRSYFEAATEKRAGRQL